MKIARLTPFSTTPAYETPLTEVEKGVEAFKAETKGLGAGAVALGAQALQAVVPDAIEPEFLQRGKEWGLRTAGEQLDSVQAPKYQPRIAKVEDITTAGDAVDWAKYQGTKGLLNVASMALGAGAGGLLGGTLAKGAVSAGVKQYAKGQVGQRLGAELITEAGKKQAKAQIAGAVAKGAARGAIAGGYASSFGMEGGDSFVSNVRKGVTPEDALAPALAVGAVAGMLDIVPGIMAAKYAGRTIKDAMSGVRKEILADATLAKKAVHVAKTAAKAGAGGVVLEGVTEGLQELVQIAGERWAKNEGFWGALSEEQRSQVLNAAAAGGLVGGVIGGAGGAARGGAEVLTPQTAEAPPASQPPATQEAAAQPPAVQPPLAQPPAAAPAFELTPPVAPTEVAPQLELQPQQPEGQMELELPLPGEQVPAEQLALDFEAPPPFALTEPVLTEPVAAEPEQPREVNPNQLEMDLQPRAEFELTMPEAPLEEPTPEPVVPRIADPRQMELNLQQRLEAPAEEPVAPLVKAPLFDRLAPPETEKESDPAYVYHATSVENLQDILDSGQLDVFQPDYGTDQAVWPDGAEEPRSYWRPDAASTASFAPAEGQPVVVRAKKTDLFKQESTGDIYRQDVLPVAELEILTSTGWEPLQAEPQTETPGAAPQPEAPAVVEQPQAELWTEDPTSKDLRSPSGHVIHPYEIGDGSPTQYEVLGPDGEFVAGFEDLEQAKRAVLPQEPPLAQEPPAASAPRVPYTEEVPVLPQEPPVLAEPPRPEFQLTSEPPQVRQEEPEAAPRAAVPSNQMELGLPPTQEEETQLAVLTRLEEQGKLAEQQPRLEQLRARLGPQAVPKVAPVVRDSYSFQPAAEQQEVRTNTYEPFATRAEVRKGIADFVKENPWWDPAEITVEKRRDGFVGVPTKKTERLIPTDREILEEPQGTPQQMAENILDKVSVLRQVDRRAARNVALELANVVMGQMPAYSQATSPQALKAKLVERTKLVEEMVEGKFDPEIRSSVSQALVQAAQTQTEGQPVNWQSLFVKEPTNPTFDPVWNEIYDGDVAKADPVQLQEMVQARMPEMPGVAEEVNRRLAAEVGALGAGERQGLPAELRALVPGAASIVASLREALQTQGPVPRNQTLEQLETVPVSEPRTEKLLQEQAKALYLDGHVTESRYKDVRDALLRKEFGRVEKFLDEIDGIATAGGNARNASVALSSSKQTAQMKVDLKRMLALNSQAAYEGGYVQTSIKETLQNSFDAVKKISKRLGGKGRIDVRLDSRARTVSIEDNGVGMSKKDVHDFFLTLGGTGKGGIGSSGGMGLAKGQFLTGAEWFELTTTKGGYTTTLRATPDEILEGRAETITEKTGTESGTVLTLKVPEGYTSSNGEERTIRFPYDPTKIEVFQKPLLGPVEVRLFTDYSPEGQTLPIGKHFDVEQNGTPFLTTVKFSWGKADVYYGKARKEYANHYVLSDGIYQFDLRLVSPNYEQVPYDIIVNVTSEVDTKDSRYPFNNTRQGFRSSIEADEKALRAYLLQISSGLASNEVADTFKDFKQLPRSVSTRGVELTPEEKAKGREALKEFVKAPPKKKDNPLASVPKKVVVNEGRVESTTGEQLLKNESKEKETMEAEAGVIERKGIQLEEGMDRSKPVYHNNTSVDYIAELGEEAAGFFAGLGSVVVDFVETLGEVGGWRYGAFAADKKDSRVFGGVSVDKSYYGVHLKAAFTAIFLNPLHVREAKTLAGIANALYLTLIHEGAHYANMEHNETHTQEIHRLYNNLADTAKDVEIREKLGDVLYKYRAVYGQMREKFNESSTRNVAQSIDKTAKLNAAPAQPVLEGRDQRAAGNAARSGQAELGIGSRSEMESRVGTGIEVAENTRGAGTRTVTRSEFEWAVEREFGRNWLRRATNLGVLRVNEASPEGSPSGVFDPATGVMTVNLDRIPVGETAVGVLLHEGSHQNLETMLGQSFGTWAGEVRELANGGNDIARRATLKALKEVASRFGVEHKLAMLEGEALQQEVVRVNGLLGEMPGVVQHLMQEQLAYYVQYAAQEPTGLFRRIMNALKAWFASTGFGQRLKEMGLGPELSDGLMVELARRAAMQGVEFSSQVAHLRADGRVTEWARTQREVVEPAMQSQPDDEALRGMPLYSMWDIAKDPGQLIFAPLGNNVSNLSRAERFTKYAIDRFDLMRQHQRREWFAVQNGKKLMALGRDKEAALQTLLSPQSGLPNDVKFKFLPTDRPLPEGQMVHEAFEAAPKRKADRRGQMHEKYLDPIFKAAARFGMTVEDLDALAYARHAGEANERLRRVTAKGWLKDLLEVLPAAEAKRVKKEREAAKLATKQDMKERQKRYLGLVLANAHLAPPDFQADWNEFYTKPSGMTEAEAAQILSEYDQGQVSQIFDVFDEMNRSVVAQLVAGGVLSQDQAAKWTGAYGHYATLKRLSHENEGTSHGSGGMSVGKAARLRYGSPDPATNVFTNTVESMERAMDLVENNRVMGTLKNFLEANPDEEFLRIVRKDTVHYLDEEGFVVEGATRSKGLHDAVGFEKGKMFIIQAANNEKARMIVGALNNMEAAKLGPVMRVFMGMTKWMAAMSTSWSPEFFFMNLQRDFLESLYNVQDQRDSAQIWKEMVKDYPKSAKALHKVFRARSKGEAVDQNDPWVKWVRAFEENGGPTGWMDVFENTQEHRKRLKTRMKELSEGMNPHKALRGVLDWIEDYNAIAENVTRLSLFKALVGDLNNPRVPVERAISLAKNLTVNFNRRGDVGTVAGALFMFANAGIQGSVRIMTALGRSATVRKMVVATVVFSALVDQLNRAMDDDDEYDKIPEHIKERNLVFMNPFGGSAVLVPAPWGYNFFWRLGQLMSEGFEHSQGRMEDWSAAGAGADVVSTFWNAFMPIHGATFAQAITPSVLRPVTQIAENKDAFGQALKPEPFPGQTIPQTEQYWSNASEASKYLTKLLGAGTGGDDVTSGVIDWSPAWIDRIVGELTGSLGRQVMSVSNLPAKALEGDLEVRDVPIVRKFVAFPSEAQETAKYHDRVAQVLDVERRLKAYAEGPRADQEKARELRQDPLRRMAPMVKDVERQLKSLRVRLKAAQSRGDKEGEERVKEKMELVRRRFNERWLAQLH